MWPLLLQPQAVRDEQEGFPVMVLQPLAQVPSSSVFFLFIFSFCSFLQARLLAGAATMLLLAVQFFLLCDINASNVPRAIFAASVLIC
jgi:hypothetical protein